MCSERLGFSVTSSGARANVPETRPRYPVNFDRSLKNNFKLLSHLEKGWWALEFHLVHCFLGPLSVVCKLHEEKIHHPLTSLTHIFVSTNWFFYMKLVLSIISRLGKPGCWTRRLFRLDFLGGQTIFLRVSTQCWWEGVTERGSWFVAPSKPSEHDLGSLFDISGHVSFLTIFLLFYFHHYIH